MKPSRAMSQMRKMLQRIEANQALILAKLDLEPVAESDDEPEAAEQAGPASVAAQMVALMTKEQMLDLATLRGVREEIKGGWTKLEIAEHLTRYLTPLETLRLTPEAIRLDDYAQQLAEAEAAALAVEGQEPVSPIVEDVTGDDTDTDAGGDD